VNRLREGVVLKQENVLRFVGVTGLPGAGKGAFVDFLRPFLAEQGVETQYYSLSDELRDEARRRELPIERPVLRTIANQLRQEHGSGVLSLMVLRKIRQNLATIPVETPLVIIIDAIRNPEEVRALRRELGQGFVLVAVEAPLEVLVRRLAARARYDEPDEVVKQEEAARKMILGESGKDEPAHGHNIKQCIEMADWRVDNSDSLEMLAAGIRSFVQEMIPAR
jgi:dephospho-CoA kinase